MWLRRVYFQWLLPAAVVLPLWLLVGWIAFNASGWVLLWVLLIAIPSVFLGQLLLTLLVRARGTVRHSRALSWWDVAGFTVWHGLTIAVGFYSHDGFWTELVLAIVAFLALFWLQLWQLFREAKPSSLLRRTSDGTAYIPAPEPGEPRSARQDPDVVIISEKHRPPTS